MFMKKNSVRVRRVKQAMKTMIYKAQKQRWSLRRGSLCTDKIASRLYDCVPEPIYLSRAGLTSITCRAPEVFSRNSQSSREIYLHCLSENVSESFAIGLTDSVQHLCSVIADQVKCQPTDLTIICNGNKISKHLTCTLDELDIYNALAKTGACKLMVLQRSSPSPKWLRIQVHTVCSTIQPLDLRVHSANLAITVKHHIRELLRNLNLVLFLHATDGELLPDDLTLRDLRIPDGGRLYCRIHTEPPLADVDAVQEERAAAAVRKLIQQMEATSHAAAGEKEVGRHTELASTAGPARRRTAFLGMRRGFLLADPAAPATGAAAPTVGEQADTETRIPWAAGSDSGAAAATVPTRTSAGDGADVQRRADALPADIFFAPC